MDDNKSPEDILDAILNRTTESSPSPTSYPPRYDPPENIPLPPLKVPDKRADPDKVSWLLPWLCLVLGVALLVLGVCVLRMNARLGDLQDAVEAIQSVDSLREENGQLRQELEETQDQFDQLQQELQDTLDETTEQNRYTYTQLVQANILTRRSEALSFLQQFIDRGDLPMAAIIMMLEDETFRKPSLNWSNDYYSRVLEMTPVQQEQYDSYRSTLVDAGYLYNSGLTQENGTTPLWVSGYDPTENPDMAALAVLWCALEQQYMERDPYAAAFYVEEASSIERIELIQNTAGAYALQLYEQMIDDLKAEEYLVEEDGQLKTGIGTDILYPLPF